MKYYSGMATQIFHSDKSGVDLSLLSENAITQFVFGMDIKFHKIYIS